LARVAGAEAAGQSLGIDPRTIRRWAAQAGDAPELDGSAEGWQRLLDLAQSRVAVALTADKVRPKDAAVIAGIAERNLRRPAPDVQTSAIAAKETFVDWLVDTVSAEPVESEEAFATLEAAIDDVVPMLLRRANAETDLATQPPSPHRVALLAWHSGRPEIEAGDVLEWAQRQVLEVIETHGSLTAWHEFQQAEDEAEHARQEAEYARLAAKAEALKAESRQASLDSETRALLAAAEAFLRDGDDG
jgi:hypothetical protein